MIPQVRLVHLLTDPYPVWLVWLVDVDWPVQVKPCPTAD